MSPSAITRLSYLLIYAIPSPEEERAARDAFADEDSQEASQVLFYYSTRNVQTRDKMLRHLGLAKGLENFVSMFDVSTEPTLITSIKSSLVTVSPEPGYYIHANVTLDSSSSSSLKSKNPADAAAPKDIPARVIESYLLQTYETFKLLNGPITALDSLYGRKETERKIEQFWTTSLSTWEFELEAGTAFYLENFLGSPLPPLSSHPPSQSSSSSPCSILLSRSHIHRRDHPVPFPPSLIHTLLNYLPPAPRANPITTNNKSKSAIYETRKSFPLDWGAKTLMHGIGIHTWRSTTPTETSSTSKNISSPTEDTKETAPRSKHSSSRSSLGGLGGIGAFFLPKDHSTQQQNQQQEIDKRRTRSTGAGSGSEKAKDGWKWLLGESLGSAIGIGGSTTPSSSSKVAAASSKTNEAAEAKDTVESEPQGEHIHADVDVNKEREDDVDPRQIPLPGSPQMVESAKEIKIDLLSEAMETVLPVPSVTESSEEVEDENQADETKIAEGEEKQDKETVEEELVWRDLKVWLDRDENGTEEHIEGEGEKEGPRESDLKFTIITFPDQKTLPILYAYFPFDPSVPALTPSSFPVPIPTRSHIMKSYHSSRQSPRAHGQSNSASANLVGLTSGDHGVWRTDKSEAACMEDEDGADDGGPAASATATKDGKVKKDARERSLLRSLEILRSDEMIQETIARTTFSSSWLISRIIPSSSSSPSDSDGPGTHANDVAMPVSRKKDFAENRKSTNRRELVGSVEGKGITLGDLDNHLAT
ncbi:Protein of unknown function DUF1712, fungi [Phaffia rhodozyma]|uniref:CCZ1/INTU/HSP4 first Longin domain-containing protein n=1 Tax=Phaffia rhodozyma TaxID=264483 RepID=A0A0F7SN83_PHARH|nr:Protein of unknown function DUF1712, fungi [Phaffia rhodozyma]